MSGLLVTPVRQRRPWSFEGGIALGPVGKVVARNIVTLALTNAQIKALRATPITLVGAPPAGFIIVPVNVFAMLKYGGTNAFTAAAGDNLALKRKDGSGAILAAGCSQAFLQNTGSAFSEWIWPTTSSNELKAVVDGQALVVHNTTAGEIAGNAAADNTLTISVEYAICGAPASW